ncbi:MAG TPA: class I SAM-dependent methyltransferase [Methanomassiliicoccales archaeon]|jgi:ubiquinone/menaquinone biosynthesis C-methylase UbiE
MKCQVRDLMSITSPTKFQISIILFFSRIGRRFIYPRFVEEMGLKGGENVLDFGSGWGDNEYYIAPKLNTGGRVTAMDVSEEWQEVAKNRLRMFHNVDFMLSDVRTSSLKDGSFDVIVVSYVLHDIPQEERAEIVTNLVRKMRPDGFLQLREPTGKHHGMPVDEIRSLMRKAGMRETFSKFKRKEFRARYALTDRSS